MRRLFAALVGAAAVLTATAQPTINFAGRSWFVKDSGGARALPGPCLWRAANVQPRPEGLWLSVAPVAGCDGDWASAEVWGTQSLGYGTYLWSIEGPLEYLDKQVTLGLFIWDDISPDAPNIHYREADIEIGRWGRDVGYEATGGQFVLQPASDPANLYRFPVSGAAVRRGAGFGAGACNDPNLQSFSGAAVQQVTCVMQWGPGSLRWACWDGLFGLGNLPGSRGLLASWTFPRGGQVPGPGNERVHLNLWQCNWGGRPQNGLRVNMLIRDFQHTPARPDLGVPPSFPGSGAWSRGLAALAAINGTAAAVPPLPAVPATPPSTLAALRKAVLGAVSSGRLGERDSSVVLGTLGLLEAGQAAHASNADSGATASSFDGKEAAHGGGKGDASKATHTPSPSPSPQPSAAAPVDGHKTETGASEPAVAWLLAMPLSDTSSGATLSDALGFGSSAPVQAAGARSLASAQQEAAAASVGPEGRPEGRTKAGVPFKLGAQCPFFAATDAAGGKTHSPGTEAATAKGNPAPAADPPSPRSLASSAASYYANDFLPSRPILRGVLAVAVAGALLASLAALGGSLKKVIAGGHRPAVFRTPAAAHGAPASAAGFFGGRARGLDRLFAGGAGQPSAVSSSSSSSSSSAVSPYDAPDTDQHPHAVGAHGHLSEAGVRNRAASRGNGNGDGHHHHHQQQQQPQQRQPPASPLVPASHQVD